MNFHAKDGSGYKFLGEVVVQLDKINPQVGLKNRVSCDGMLRYFCSLGNLLIHILFINFRLHPAWSLPSQDGNATTRRGRTLLRCGVPVMDAIFCTLFFFTCQFCSSMLFSVPLLQAQLEMIMSTNGLSENVFEIASKSLAA